MPLLRDPVHTLNMQFHCMKINQNTINAVNPGQTPVDVSDQPVYALTKEIQWRFPTEFKDVSDQPVYALTKISHRIQGILSDDG